MGFDGLQRRYIRDRAGRVIKVLRPDERYTSYMYDGVGNILAADHYDGTGEYFAYDTDGKLVEATNAEATVTYSYDSKGRLIEETQNGHAVQSKYDRQGNRTAITSSLGANITHEFNLNGQLTRIEAVTSRLRSMLNQDETSNPDNTGNKNKTPGQNKTLNQDKIPGHDKTSNYNEMSSQDETSRQDETSSRVNPMSSGVNPMSSEVNPMSNEVNPMSNEVNPMSNEVNPMSSGVETWGATFERDELGLELRRMVQANQGTTLLDMRTERDKKGRVIHQNIQTKNVEGGKTTQSRSMQYQWASSDRLRSTIDQLTGKTVNYSYDTAGSLLAASYKGNTETIYKMPDAVGNLFKTKGRKDRTYGKGGQLLKDEKATYKYDAEGNLSHKQTIQGTETYTYYGNGMLKSIAKPNGKEITFEYDALGRRTAKIYNQKITRFVYDGNVLLHEWEYTLEDRPKLSVNAKGFVVSDAVEPVDGANLISWVFDYNSFVPAAKIVDGNTYSIACDHLGTPVQAYNQTGEKVWERQLDIYGATKYEEGETNFIPFLYQGQFLDSETGLAYNRFRYYSPDTGTYISQDPIGLNSGEPNFYSYVSNSNAWIDPLGLLEIGEVAGYGSKAHVGDNLDAHEMLRNAFLKDSPLTDITTRSGAKGNPAMALDKPLHKAVHDAEARIKASKGMGRNEYFKRGKHNIRVMYQAMQEVLVDSGIISQQELRNMKRQAEKFAKSKGCH